jgi:hypothetical protein
LQIVYGKISDSMLYWIGIFVYLMFLFGGITKNYVRGHR